MCSYDKVRADGAWRRLGSRLLTRQVDLCEGVPGRGPGGRQQVDRLVVDVVAVAQVQVGQQRHLPDDETQRRVGDVEPRQTQVLHVAQLAPVVQLTCRRGRAHTRTSASFTHCSWSSWNQLVMVLVWSTCLIFLRCFVSMRYGSYFESFFVPWF